VLPPEAKNYRNAVEQITNFRLNVVETNEDVRSQAKSIAFWWYSADALAGCVGGRH
jgi:hypothetical protein